MNKKAYLWLYFMPLIICLCHFHNVLPQTAENIFGWIFNLFGDALNICFFCSGAYYCFINYSFFRSNLRKAFLFSLLGLSLWWGIDTVLYFAVGYVDNIGIFLMKCMAAYNYIIFAISWGIVYIIARHKAKKAE